MIEDAHAKGYETTCNIMALSNAREQDLEVALHLLGQSSVDTIYIVDSYGSFYPEQIARTAHTFLEICGQYGKKWESTRTTTSSSLSPTPSKS